MSTPLIDNDGVIPITQEDLDEHTIQALIELVYVRTANDLLADALASLERSLAITKDAVQTLTTLQNLHNKIDVSAKSAFGFDYSGGGDYAGDYTDEASAYFGTPIDPFFPLSSGDPAFDDFQEQLLDMRDKLDTLIEHLEPLTPQVDGQEDPNSLLGTLRAVRADLDNVDDYNGVRDWVLDNYNTHTGANAALAGDIQQRITLAMTAGSNLNDTQSESVRRYLFIFEEYYKSAAGLLTKISQLIEKMAQSISR